jgi:hypothetical protein
MAKKMNTFKAMQEYCGQAAITYRQPVQPLVALALEQLPRILNVAVPPRRLQIAVEIGEAPEMVCPVKIILSGSN